MIGKGISIGRSVVALQDLFMDLEDHENVISNKTVEKIISIHKLNKTKRTGFSSGQGYDINYNLWRTKLDKCAFNVCCWNTKAEA